MNRFFTGCGAAIFGVAFGTQGFAQSVPPILANFPVTQDEALQSAFADRVRASFPRDIRTSTLTALLEMDGFDVTTTKSGYAASFVQTEFPCITDYVLTWQEGERGRVDDLHVETRHKCV